MVAVTDPVRVDVVGGADAIGAGVLGPAQVEEDLSVGTGLAGDEQNQVVRAGELHQMLMPVRDLRTDGVMDRDATAEGADPGADIGVFGRALGRLGEDFHGFGEVDAGKDVLQHRPVLHHDGVAIHLAQQTQDLGMADFSEDDQRPVLSVRVQAGIGLPIMCGVFLLESVSVIVQRAYFKMGKKKGVHQRVWKRTPIHDHFRTSMEQVLNADPSSTVVYKGKHDLLHEMKITVRFWIVTIILVAFAILTLKIR